MINLIRKKGILNILKSLKVEPLNYNTIKRRNAEYFSARTLDFRLKELLEYEIIENSIIKQESSNNFNYSLTDKGVMMLTLFQLIENLMYDEFNFDSFQNLFSLKLMENRSSDFKFVWELLKEILLEKKVIYTLKKKKPNRILSVDDKGITVQTEKGIALIKIQQIEDAWYHFIRKGLLECNNYEKASYRSSFMLALFSQLPFIKLTQNPISIKFKSY